MPTRSEARSNPALGGGSDSKSPDVLVNDVHSIPINAIGSQAISSRGSPAVGAAHYVRALCEACSWQVCLSQDAPDLSEHLVEWR